MTLAILGLGAMGVRMARRAADAGVDVVTWNRSERTVPGTRRANTPREAAEAATVVLSMVTDIDASRAVWMGENGALAGLSSSSIAIEASTVTPGWTKELAAAVTGRGAAILEAPVVGTRPHAEQGTLTVLVGGAADTFEQVRPILETWGQPKRVGPIGAAMTLKLSINSMFATQVVLLAEVLALLRAEGAALEDALAALEPTPVFAPILGSVGALLRSGTDDPMFPVDLVAKDLGYAADQAPSPLLEAVRTRYLEASARGLGARNLHAVARLYAIGAPPTRQPHGSPTPPSGEVSDNA